MTNISYPCFAPIEVATKVVVGAANPKAHGQATTNTSIANFKASKKFG